MNIFHSNREFPPWNRVLYCQRRGICKTITRWNRQHILHIAKQRKLTLHNAPHRHRLEIACFVSRSHHVECMLYGMLDVVIRPGGYVDMRVEHQQIEFLLFTIFIHGKWINSLPAATHRPVTRYAVYIICAISETQQRTSFLLVQRSIVFTHSMMNCPSNSCTMTIFRLQMENKCANRYWHRTFFSVRVSYSEGDLKPEVIECDECLCDGVFTRHLHRKYAILSWCLKSELFGHLLKPVPTSTPNTMHPATYAKHVNIDSIPGMAKSVYGMEFSIKFVSVSKK